MWPCFSTNKFLATAFSFKLLSLKYGGCSLNTQGKVDPDLWTRINFVLIRPLNGEQQMTPCVFRLPTTGEAFQMVLMLGSVPDEMRCSYHPLATTAS